MERTSEGGKDGRDADHFDVDLGLVLGKVDESDLGYYLLLIVYLLMPMDCNKRGVKASYIYFRRLYW
jgi:hypothetical protein